MKRLLAMVLLVLVTGCSRVLGTGEWDRIDVAFDAGSGDPDGDYSLVITPTEVRYEFNDEPGEQELPDGMWTVLTTGVRALGERSGDSCPDGQSIEIEAISGDISSSDAVQQTFQASSCEADGAFDQARSMIEQVVSRLS